MPEQRRQPTLSPPPSRTVRKDSSRRVASAHIDTRPIGSTIPDNHQGTHSDEAFQDRKKKVLPTLILILSGLLLIGIIAGLAILIFFA